MVKNHSICSDNDWSVVGCDKKGVVVNVPAAGVMQTKPVIMPCTAPITEGFPKTNVSRMTQVSKLVAAQTCVLRAASDASTLAT